MDDDAAAQFRPRGAESERPNLHVVEDAGAAQVNRPIEAHPESTRKSTVPIDGIMQAQYESVLDAIWKSHKATLKGHESQLRGDGKCGLDDPNFYAAADRLAVEEAWAKAGIPTMNTPRGIIELTQGLLDSERVWRTLDDRIKVEISKLRGELAVMEAGQQFIVAQRQLTGETDTIQAQMKLEEARLHQQLRYLQAEVQRKREETNRELAMLEVEKVNKIGWINHQWAMRQADMDRKLGEYQQYINYYHAEAMRIRVNADLKLRLFTAHAYAKRFWIYGLLTLAVFGIILFILLASL